MALRDRLEASWGELACRPSFVDTSKLLPKGDLDCVHLLLHKTRLVPKARRQSGGRMHAFRGNGELSGRQMIAAMEEPELGDASLDGRQGKSESVGAGAADGGVWPEDRVEIGEPAAQQENETRSTDGEQCRQAWWSADGVSRGTRAGTRPWIGSGAESGSMGGHSDVGVDSGREMEGVGARGELPCGREQEQHEEADTGGVQTHGHEAERGVEGIAAWDAHRGHKSGTDRARLATRSLRQSANCEDPRMKRRVLREEPSSRSSVEDGWGGYEEPALDPVPARSGRGAHATSHGNARLHGRMLEGARSHRIGDPECQGHGERSRFPLSSQHAEQHAEQQAEHGFSRSGRRMHMHDEEIKSPDVADDVRMGIKDGEGSRGSWDAERGHRRTRAHGVSREAWHTKDLRRGSDGEDSLSRGALRRLSVRRVHERRMHEREWRDEFDADAPHITKDWNAVDEEHLEGSRPQRTGL
jgi:hypothetical protein